MDKFIEWFLLAIIMFLVLLVSGAFDVDAHEIHLSDVQAEIEQHSDLTTSPVKGIGYVLSSKVADKSWYLYQDFDLLHLQGIQLHVKEIITK